MVNKYFKAIIIGLIVMSIFLLVWMNQWKYFGDGKDIPMRINRITGAVCVFRPDALPGYKTGWIKVGQKEKKS